MCLHCACVGAQAVIISADCADGWAIGWNKPATARCPMGSCAFCPVAVEALDGLLFGHGCYLLAGEADSVDEQERDLGR
jgi:hypothetical protein